MAIPEAASHVFIRHRIIGMASPYILVATALGVLSLACRESTPESATRRSVAGSLQDSLVTFASEHPSLEALIASTARLVETSGFHEWNRRSGRATRRLTTEKGTIDLRVVGSPRSLLKHTSLVSELDVAIELPLPIASDAAWKGPPVSCTCRLFIRVSETGESQLKGLVRFEVLPSRSDTSFISGYSFWTVDEGRLALRRVASQTGGPDPRADPDAEDGLDTDLQHLLIPDLSLLVNSVEDVLEKTRAASRTIDRERLSSPETRDR